MPILGVSAWVKDGGFEVTFQFPLPACSLLGSLLVNPNVAVSNWHPCQEKSRCPKDQISIFNRQKGAYNSADELA